MTAVNPFNRGKVSEAMSLFIARLQPSVTVVWQKEQIFCLCVLGVVGQFAEKSFAVVEVFADENEILLLKSTLKMGNIGP